jgi:hypothetical protein
MPFDTPEDYADAIGEGKYDELREDIATFWAEAAITVAEKVEFLLIVAAEVKQEQPDRFYPFCDHVRWGIDTAVRRAAVKGGR